VKGGEEMGTRCTRRHSRNQSACEGQMALTRNWERPGTCWARRPEQSVKTGRSSRCLSVGLEIFCSLKKKKPVIIKNIKRNLSLPNQAFKHQEMFDLRLPGNLSVASFSV